MKIETLVLGQLQTNCYLVYDPLTNEGLIIDPADEAEFIAEKIQRLKFKPKAIVATHGHFDHVLAAGELQIILNKFQFPNSKFQTNSKSKIQNSKQFSNSTIKQSNNGIPFYIHQNDLFLLKQMNKSASYWLGCPIKKLQPLNTKFIKEKDTISFGNYQLKVIETPCHTPGSVCFLLNSLTHKHVNPLTLFSGDTLFKNGVGRYDFSYSNKEELNKSLRKLFKLPKETVVYPGHGEKTTIHDEK